MSKLEGRWLTLSLEDNKNLKLELTPEGRERVDEIRAWSQLPFTYPDKENNEDPQAYLRRCELARNEWEYNDNNPLSMNDHQILHELLGDLIENDELTWEYGYITALHGSFIIVGHGGPISVHTEEDGDVADYWYDNFYAVRDIIKDLTYNYDTQGKKMSVLPRYPAPVILWLGPTNE